MKRTILITEPVNQKGIDLLKEQGYDVRMGSGPQEVPSSQSACDCDGALNPKRSVHPSRI